MLKIKGVEMACTSGGKEIPQACVDALNEFERVWPGATFHYARTGIAIEVVEAYLKVLKANGYTFAKKVEEDDGLS